MTAIWVPRNVSDLLDWKNGTLTAPGGDIPMGGFGLTGMRAAAANGEAVRYEESPQGVFTTKGDILVASAAHALARLAVGSDGQLLQADAASPNGVKWATKDMIVLGVSGTAATHTSDTSEFALKTIAIPANTLLANGVVVIFSFWSLTGASSTTATVRARLGASGSGLSGTALNSAVTGNASAAGLQVWMFSNVNATNSQVGAASSGNNLDNLASTGGVLTAAIDTTAATEINLTGQLSNSGNTIALKSLVAVCFPHA